MNADFLDFPVYEVPDAAGLAQQVKGQLNRGILVITNEPDNTSGPDNFLSKILSAVKIDQEEATGLLVLTEQTANWLAPLLHSLKVKYLLTFGISPSQLGIRIEASLYQPVFLNDLTLLWSDPLSVIRQTREAGDPRRAGALWKAMQHLFLSKDA